MGITYCLSLCETAERHLAPFGGNPHAMLATYVAQANFPGCHRLYVGSSFCAQRLLNTPSSFYQTVAELCRAYDLHVTLTLPIATQQTLESVKERASTIERLLWPFVDEFTVNDLGMLEHISRTHDVGIFLGRLFSRDHRDPRYPESYEHVHHPDILSFDLLQAQAAYPALRGVELDPTASVIDASAAPESLEVALHLPFCYISTSHLCEYAARDKSPDRAFRAECPCASECLDCHTRYEEENGVRFIKIGKTIYYRNADAAVEGASSTRLIYTPHERGWRA